MRKTHPKIAAFRMNQSCNMKNSMWFQQIQDQMEKPIKKFTSVFFFFHLWNESAESNGEREGDFQCEF